MIKSLVYKSLNPCVLKGKTTYQCFDEKLKEVDGYVKSLNWKFWNYWKVLLLMHNVPVHPPSLRLDHPKVSVFLLNTTSILQHLDQALIAAFKGPLIGHWIQ